MDDAETASSIDDPDALLYRSVLTSSDKLRRQSDSLNTSHRTLEETLAMTMGALHFKDFVPNDLTQFMNLRRRYETARDVLDRIDEWLEETGVELVNCETVVVPGSPSSSDEDMMASTFEISVGSFSTAKWSQFIRVWYRDPNAGPADST